MIFINFLFAEYVEEESDNTDLDNFLYKQQQNKQQDETYKKMMQMRKKLPSYNIIHQNLTCNIQSNL